ncbi:MAG: NAD(P)/FAD-dependent oxidoreductase [SAR202 cluster bacterium]|nr:NAD(P)/FAD-dependent oxidoreductase [SAR202 cluster bacterium]|tara:strand:+ start:233 stop:1381 length:1149 start_codon:yes stop_codon:yes gene_type:complete
MAGKKVLVLGGGFGGVQSAINARSALDSAHEITVIDKDRVSHLCGMNPLLIVGERETNKTGRSLGRLTNRGIKFIQANIESIDTDAQEVITSSGTFNYDYLVIALGAAYDWDAVPGAKGAYSFYDFNQARRLRRRLTRIKRGKIVLAASKPPYKCPPAPFETAMILHWWAGHKGIRKDLEISVYIPEPGPLGVAGKDASMKVRNALEKRGIELVTSAGVTEVSIDGREANFSNGSFTTADVIATVPVHKLPDVVAMSGIAKDKPWVPVNSGTLETSISNVFAIGDVNVVPAGEFSIPKAGVFAAAQGSKVGEIIGKRINKSEDPEPYDGVGFCYLAYSGNRSATVGGEFLANGGPVTILSEPTTSKMKSKVRFEKNWRNFKV